MSYTFSLQPSIDAIRSMVKTAYAIPDGHAIPEAGNQPVTVSADALPLATLKTAAVPFEDSGQGMGVKSVVWVLTVECWLLAATTADTDDTAGMRSTLETLANAVYADRHLGGNADRIRVAEMNWTGEGRDWPFAPASGVGVACGYLTVEVLVAVRDA